MQKFFVQFFRLVHGFLEKPNQVFWTCVGIAVINIILDGSLFRLWGLYRDHKDVQTQVAQLQLSTEEMTMRLKKAKDPSFLEREARDRLDLVSEGDLVFVFAENE